VRSLTTRLAAATLLIVGCGPYHQPAPAPGTEADRQFPLPPNRYLLGSYLTLRHGLTQESPVVVVCHQVDIDLAQFRNVGTPSAQVRAAQSISRSPDCRPPRENAVDPPTPSLILTHIQRGEWIGTLLATRSMSGDPLGEWTECYQFEQGERRLSVSDSQTEDCAWMPQPVAGPTVQELQQSTPQVDSLLTRYLDLRQLVRPRSLLVLVCDRVALPDPERLARGLQDQELIQTFGRSGTCAHPSLAGADSTTEALVIRRVLLGREGLAIDVAVARPWVGYPQTWDEVFLHRDGGDAIEFRHFPAID
jgi:hypothetical protein